jgi:dTDP-4-amino-4,6-dideoxygalactose transaminase
MSRDDIFVTKPALPPLDEFIPYLRRIWDTRLLTNGGPFHEELELALCKHLGLGHISLFTNGTIALISALQSLCVGGEVITTPFSFTATSHSLLWNGIRPVFVDIEPDTLNLDASKIEASITPITTAILAVHCYGRPCDVEAIEDIAKRRGLKVIYDAAHAFGVTDEGGSILRHGDLSVLSFHATKVFNTFEGGAIVCHDAETKLRIDRLKNFGYAGETNVASLGMNGKMSEFNAALGILQLQHIDAALARRKVVDAHYRRRLNGVRGIHCLGFAGEKIANYAYFPVLVNGDYPIRRDDLYHKLKERRIHPRRYFYPLLSEFSMYREFPSARRDNLPQAVIAADQVLCLPIYPDLEAAIVDEVCDIIAGE